MADKTRTSLVRGASRRLLLAAAVVLFGAGLAVAIIVRSSNGGGDAITPEESRRRLTEALDSGSIPSKVEPATAKPDATTAELTKVVEAGHQRSYYARYDITDGSSRAPTVLEVWRRPPLLRQMTTARSPAGDQRNQVFVLQSGVVGCASAGGGPWACQPRPEVRPAAADPFALPDPALLAARTVTGRNDRVGDRAVRCFDLGGDPASELCVTPEGIPVRLTFAQSRLELRELRDESPPNSAFALPS